MSNDSRSGQLRSVRGVGIFLLVMVTVLLVALLFLLDSQDPEVRLFVLGYPLSQDQALALAVLTAGALGSFVHLATSFSDYVGNARYRATWEWWYLLRPAVGGALALVFYFVVRGGILSLTGTTPNAAPNIYGMLALAGLVGMFSKQATDKLDDVFDTLFNTDKDAARGDGLEAPAPRLDALAPATLDAGSAGTTVALTGAGFVAESRVRWNGVTREAQLVGETQLTLLLTAADLLTPGTVQVSVVNPAPGGGESRPLAFTVADRRQSTGTPDDRGTAISATTDAAASSSPMTAAADSTVSSSSAVPAVTPPVAPDTVPSPVATTSPATPAPAAPAPADAAPSATAADASGPSNGAASAETATEREAAEDAAAATAGAGGGQPATATWPSQP